jgi:hypothetical protein
VLFEFFAPRRSRPVLGAVSAEGLYALLDRRVPQPPEVYRRCRAELPGRRRILF